MMGFRHFQWACVNRHPYPTEFIEGLIETAERANTKDVRTPYILQRLRKMQSALPGPEISKELKALIPQLCWIISKASGWFYGPGGQY
jgi:hypothetical protein